VCAELAEEHLGLILIIQYAAAALKVKVPELRKRNDFEGDGGYLLVILHGTH